MACLSFAELGVLSKACGQHTQDCNLSLRELDSAKVPCPGIRGAWPGSVKLEKKCQRLWGSSNCARLCVPRAAAVLLPQLRGSPEQQQLQAFLEASKKGNLVPVFRRIFSDHLTPVLAYRCLVKEDDREAPSFLFESVENGVDGCNEV